MLVKTAIDQVGHQNGCVQKGGGEHPMSTRSDWSVKKAERRCSSFGVGYIAAFLGVAFSLLAWSPAWPGVATDQLKVSVDQVIRTLEDPALQSEPKRQERRTSIRKEADKIFDFEETAKRALGRHWQSLSEKDRQEFVPLFADLLERAYISKIERYSGEKITYAGDSVDGELATVKTRFTTKKGTEIPVDYRMLRRGDRWLVYDVNVEGVSLVANYRTQFDKIIQTASYQELVAKMKHSQGEGEFSAPGGSKDKAKTPRS